MIKERGSYAPWMEQESRWSLRAKVGENHGMRSFQAAGFQPARPENRTCNLENICGLEDMDDEENASELG